MKKCLIQNLGMIVTHKCNLDCAHCLMGKKEDKCMPDNVIEATLDQTCYIGNLAITGGEVTLAVDRIKKIISYVIENHIKIDEFTVTINGTIYSKELLELLDEIDCYIGNDEDSTLLAISLDNYHIAEIKRLGLEEEFIENTKRYQESKYFYEFRRITQKMFREGNAVNLDEKLTVPLRPMQDLITYVDKNGKFDLENGLCNIGPLVAINADGIITDCNASIVNQQTLYNYGNILNDSIEEVFLNRGAHILKPRKFEKTSYKTLKKFWTYNK